MLQLSSFPGREIDQHIVAVIPRRNLQAMSVQIGVQESHRVERSERRMEHVIGSVSTINYGLSWRRRAGQRQVVDQPDLQNVTGFHSQGRPRYQAVVIPGLQDAAGDCAWRDGEVQGYVEHSCVAANLIWLRESVTDNQAAAA